MEACSTFEDGHSLRPNAASAGGVLTRIASAWAYFIHGYLHPLPPGGGRRGIAVFGTTEVVPLRTGRAGGFKEQKQVLRFAQDDNHFL